MIFILIEMSLQLQNFIFLIFRASFMDIKRFLVFDVMYISTDKAPEACHYYVADKLVCCTIV